MVSIKELITEAMKIAKKKKLTDQCTIGEVSSALITDKNKIYSDFDKLFEKFRDSILVISYRSDGIPSIEELINILRRYKQTIHEIKRKDYKYALSTNEIEEVLLIGE